MNMPVSDDEFRELQQRCIDLADRLEKLETHCLEMFAMQTKHFAKINDRLARDEDLFDITASTGQMVQIRLTALESKVFPTLQDAMHGLQKVIGPDNNILSNPLDVRKSTDPPDRKE